MSSLWINIAAFVGLFALAGVALLLARLAVTRRRNKLMARPFPEEWEQILTDHADGLTRIAEALLEREVLDAEQIAALVKGEELPARKASSPAGPEEMPTASPQPPDSGDDTASDGPAVLPEPGNQPA